MAKNKANLPKTIFVKKIDDGHDSYLSASEVAADIVDEFETEEVLGIYELKEIRKAKKEVVFTLD